MSGWFWAFLLFFGLFAYDGMVREPKLYRQRLKIRQLEKEIKERNRVPPNPDVMAVKMKEKDLRQLFKDRRRWRAEMSAIEDEMDAITLKKLKAEARPSSLPRWDDAKNQARLAWLSQKKSRLEPKIASLNIEIGSQQREFFELYAKAFPTTAEPAIAS